MKRFTSTQYLLTAILALSACAESSNNMLVPNSVFPKQEFSEKPQDFAVFNPKVDILFVIDNSGSMDTTQQNLSRNAYLFADAISKMSILDYHIGVVTTDMDYSSCNSQCGRLQGYPAYVDKTTPNMVNVLSRKMIAGSMGSSTEEMFSPVEMALSAPLNTTANQGFYRPDAYLAIIFITDAKDQSTILPQEFIQFLNTKKGDSNKVLGYGVIRTLAESKSCDSSEDLDDKLETFLASVSNGDKSQKNILSLCNSDYGTKLAEFAKDIVSRSAGIVKLNRIPDPKTIVVTYGTQVIPNNATTGWVYQPSTNSILLAEGIDWVIQGANVGLAINFEVIDTK